MFKSRKRASYMSKLPRFIENALGQVDVLDTSGEEKSIQGFVEKWGGSTPAHFLKALREGDRGEQQLAAFALGETRSAWARDILIPYLEHEDAGVRWAAALTLGQMREEAAFPVLLRMLQEFLPPDQDRKSTRLNSSHVKISYA